MKTVLRKTILAALLLCFSLASHS
ncbi:MAG: hypothetical protein JWQ30_281, partial [Sediminibacterium sp.]|nr:hypothetical protein [Sediminibacterium sp.]